MLYEITLSLISASEISSYIKELIFSDHMLKKNMGDTYYYRIMSILASDNHVLVKQKKLIKALKKTN